jgi:hypothetical protein
VVKFPEVWESWLQTMDDTLIRWLQRPSGPLFKALSLAITGKRDSSSSSSFGSHACRLSTTRAVVAVRCGVACSVHDHRTGVRGARGPVRGGLGLAGHGAHLPGPHHGPCLADSQAVGPPFLPHAHATLTYSHARTRRLAGSCGDHGPTWLVARKRDARTKRVHFRRER